MQALGGWAVSRVPSQALQGTAWPAQLSDRSRQRHVDYCYVVVNTIVLGAQRVATDTAFVE